MSAHLAQVCLFAEDGSKLRRFCEILSGQVEVDNGSLLSFHMGASAVAHHPPVEALSDNDVLVTLQVQDALTVDQVHGTLLASGLAVDDQPVDTEWGWRLFYFRVAPHLVFEVGAPLS